MTTTHVYTSMYATLAAEFIISVTCNTEALTQSQLGPAETQL